MAIDFDNTIFVTSNLRSIVAADKAVEAHKAELGIEGDVSIQTWHLVASLSEFCASHGVTLQAVLDDVNNDIRSGQLVLPASAKLLRKEMAVAPRKQVNVNPVVLDSRDQLLAWLVGRDCARNKKDYEAALSRLRTQYPQPEQIPFFEAGYAGDECPEITAPFVAVQA